MAESPLVTSVMISYNNAKTVLACLESVINQNYPRMETIVVHDTGSVDGTEEVLGKFREEHIGSIEIVAVPHTGRSAARNIGWRRGRGDIIFFADADDLYDPDYVSLAVESFRAGSPGGVAVTGTSLVEGNGFASRMLKIYSLIQKKLRANSKFDPTWAWVYSKEALERAGGFDERLSQAEDKDICERVKGLGLTIAFVDGVHWHHRRPSSIRVYLRKTLLGGARRVPYMIKHKDALGIVRSTAIIWLLIGLGLAQLFYQYTLPIAGLALASYLIIRVAAYANLIWTDVGDRWGLVAYPLFGLLAYTASAIGTLAGLIGYVAHSPSRSKPATTQ